MPHINLQPVSLNEIATSDYTQSIMHWVDVSILNASVFFGKKVTLINSKGFAKMVEHKTIMMMDKPVFTLWFS